MFRTSTSTRQFRRCWRAPREIGAHRFDCLLSADNTGILLNETSEDASAVTTETARTLLRRIALVAGEQNKPVTLEQLDLTGFERQVFADLCDRSVVTVRDDKYKIRVLLFSEYLRGSRG